MKVMKDATANVEEHQPALKPGNSHRTITASEKIRHSYSLFKL
ncbi:MAG TPA: hypothetical protein VGP35_06545 [Terriglobales bacterium]|jgi:hypothetical protein|nr:hypothetical protein [Terriglobales bacterium]